MKIRLNANIKTGQSSDCQNVRLIWSQPTLRFSIDYPLTNAKSVELTHADGSGWTIAQFIQAVCEQYKIVYAEENENPGLLPGMLNRARSYGPHGIWGHNIDDLVLEGAHLNRDGSWQLLVGS